MELVDWNLIMHGVFKPEERLTAGEVAFRLGYDRDYVVRILGQLIEAGYAGSTGGIHCPYKRYYLQNPTKHPPNIPNKDFDFLMRVRMYKEDFDKFQEKVGKGRVSEVVRSFMHEVVNMSEEFPDVVVQCPKCAEKFNVPEPQWLEMVQTAMEGT